MRGTLTILKQIENNWVARGADIDLLLQYCVFNCVHSLFDVHVKFCGVCVCVWPSVDEGKKRGVVAWGGDLVRNKYLSFPTPETTVELCQMK